MSTAMRLTTVITAGAITLFASTSPPRCIGDLTSGESGATAHLPAPAVTPDRGAPGTRVTIRGDGFRPGAGVTIAAVFAENDCVIEGLGDEFLSPTVADGRGAYSVTIRWPSLFDPVLGRNKTDARALPRGRYYVFALPCAARASCSFTDGTRPGGPFLLGEARASPLGWIAPTLALAGALLSGILLIRRRTR